MFVVSIIAGLLIITAALTRVGRYIAYIPWPVVEGFTLGIAVIMLWIGGRGDNAGVARRGVGLLVGLVALGIAVSGNGPAVGQFLAQLITG